MFDGIRNVHCGSIDSRLGQRAIEQTAGRPDESTARAILFIAWLFADEYDG